MQISIIEALIFLACAGVIALLTYLAGYVKGEEDVFKRNQTPNE